MPAHSLQAASCVPVCVVGIDVSKSMLDVAADDQSAIRRFPNTPAGHAELGRHLVQLRPVRIVLEATGGYERPALLHLRSLRLNAVRVNPRNVRDFAKAQGTLAKTDALDARVLARFAAVMQPKLRPLPEPEEQELQTLVTRRRQLVQLRVMEKNRQETCSSRVALKSIRRMIKTIDSQIDELEAEISDLIAEHKKLGRRIEIAVSVPGIGTTTAAVLVAGMPELGALSRQAVASLAGLAPFNDDSGQHRGKRSIRGGRVSVRTTLYMATLVATRHNPRIREMYSRLIQNGKPPKVAITACMRKLITIVNALIRDDVLWTDTQPQSPAK